MALVWTRLNGVEKSTLMVARNFAQLTDNLAGLAIESTDAQIAALDAASRVEQGFPHDMLNSPVAHCMFGGVTVEKPVR